jgi:aminopeptidase N
VIPTLCVFENGAWRMDEGASIGDPFYQECANYTLTLHLPQGYTPACSLSLNREKDHVWSGSGLALRDVGLCVSNRFQGIATGKTDGIQVTAYAENASDAKAALGYARKALETYAALYGPYPWPNFTVCSAPFAPGAMEYACMAVVNEAYFAPSSRDTLELFIAHETAHQWFFSLVGSDQVNQPWQDEALCEYAMLRYVEKRYGASAYENLRFLRVDQPMQERVPGGLTPGSPITYFSSLMDYKTVVYGRGAGLLIALDRFLPSGTDAFLRHYTETFAFSIASRQDFEDTLNRFSGQDLAPLVQDYLDTKMME